MNGIFDDLYQLPDECLAPIVQDPANTGRSWDRCYSFFQKYHGCDREQQQVSIELACLNLGFYLASRAMFRGVLIHKDYTIYEGVIDLLLAQEYEGLWEPDFFQDLLMGEDAIPQENEQVTLILKLAEQIRDISMEWRLSEITARAQNSFVQAIQ